MKAHNPFAPCLYNIHDTHMVQHVLYPPCPSMYHVPQLVSDLFIAVFRCLQLVKDFFCLHQVLFRDSWGCTVAVVSEPVSDPGEKKAPFDSWEWIGRARRSCPLALDRFAALSRLVDAADGKLLDCFEYPAIEAQCWYSVLSPLPEW